MNATSEILHGPDSTGLCCSQCDCKILGAMTAISVVTEYWVNEVETQPTDSFGQHHFCSHFTALFNFSALSVPLTEAAKRSGVVARPSSPAKVGPAMAHCSDCNDAVCVGDTMTSVSVEQWPDPYVTDAFEAFSTHQFCVHCAPRFDFAALDVPPAIVLLAQA